MFEFLTAIENTPFSVALVLMFGIAILEGLTTLLGFALSSVLDTLLPDFHLEIDLASELETPSPLSRVLSWLRVGKVPVLMLLIIFLTAFALIGLTLQALMQNTYGSLLPSYIIFLPALILAFPIVRVCGGVLNRLMPGDETDAVMEESLIGHIATITLGTATVGKPAEARVKDKHGTTHYIMVEPDTDNVVFTNQNSILLISKKGATFTAIENTNPALLDKE